MSQPPDPGKPESRPATAGRQSLVRRTGEFLGFQYDLGIQVSELIATGVEPPVARLPPGGETLAAPAGEETLPQSGADAVAQWEWEGGAIR